VVNKQKLGNRRTCFYHGRVTFAGDFHAVHDRRLTRSHEFGHGARVFFRAFGDAYKASAALATRALQRGIIAHGGRHELTANLSGSVEDGSAVGDFDFDSVYCYFGHFTNSNFGSKFNQRCSENLVQFFGVGLIEDFYVVVFFQVFSSAWMRVVMILNAVSRIHRAVLVVLCCGQVANVQCSHNLAPAL